MGAWDNLSVKEKADIMKVAISNGITNLSDIKQRYNEFAEGGPVEESTFTSELDWSPESWFSKRAAKPDGTYYNEEEAARLASHVPEYLTIEENAKNNGTWLQNSDGSKWEGDPRSWVMMQSEAYKKNYSTKPWYTGQAEWPTKFDYGQGTVETNKVTRAPYYNEQMWFSDNKDYGDTFANYQNSKGTDWRFDTPGEEDIKGQNFLAAIPKKGNYRHLEGPSNSNPDNWQHMPFSLENNTINRLPAEQIILDSKGRNIRADKQKVLTDDVVNWSKSLGDQGIFMYNVDDGDVIKDGYITPQSVNEFISQPGFTDKVKFIEGNTGDFDINNPYKYAYIPTAQKSRFNLAALGGNLFDIGGPQNLPIKTTGGAGYVPSVNFSSVTEDITNIYKYLKNYFSNRLSEKDRSAFIDLSNKNVSRIKKNTKGVETILTNEFVEDNDNTIKTKKQFKNTTDTLLGDKKIPLSKISTFYGIEDGKLKAGSLDDFKDETVVIPNRAKNIGKVVKVIAPSKDETKKNYKIFRDSVSSSVDAYNKERGYKPDFLTKLESLVAFQKPGPFNTLYDNTDSKEFRHVIDSINNIYRPILNKTQLKVINEKGDTISGYSLNATPKALFANEQGNAVFVSDLHDNERQLNDWLKENPSYPIMVDNGRYGNFMLSKPNIGEYIGFGNPDKAFVLGTTKKSLGGNLYPEGGPVGEEPLYDTFNDNSDPMTDKNSWLIHWYNNRTKQLADAERNRSHRYPREMGDAFRSLLPNNMTDTYFANLGKNYIQSRLNTVSEGILPDRVYGYKGDLTPKQIDIAAKSLMRNVNGIDDYEEAKKNLDCLNYLQHGAYYPYYHTILYSPRSEADTRIHERTHSFSEPYLNQIWDYWLNNDFNKDDVKYDSYLDDPTEIYSRLNEFRYKNKLNPKHKVTNEELQKLKENSEDRKLLDRYNDDFLLHLLNNVAQNPIDDYKNSNVAALGGNLYPYGGPVEDPYDKALVDYVIKKEGFLKAPKNIGDGKMTLGSGLTNPKWHKLYKQKGVWTAEDNRNAVIEELAWRRKWAEKNVPNWGLLPRQAQNAMLSYKYNYDFNEDNSPKMYQALRDKNWEEVARQMNATSKIEKFKKGLEQRRQEEQEMFIEGVGQLTPPYMRNRPNLNYLTGYRPEEEIPKNRVIVRNPEINGASTLNSSSAWASPMLQYRGPVEVSYKDSGDLQGQRVIDKRPWNPIDFLEGYNN